jgi:hypothetical protein
MSAPEKLTKRDLAAHLIDPYAHPTPTGSISSGGPLAALLKWRVDELESTHIEFHEAASRPQGEKR